MLHEFSQLSGQSAHSVFGRSQVRILLGTQIYSLSHAHGVLIISSSHFCSPSLKFTIFHFFTKINYNNDQFNLTLCQLTFFSRKLAHFLVFPSPQEKSLTKVSRKTREEGGKGLNLCNFHLVLLILKILTRQPQGSHLITALSYSGTAI